MGGHCAALLLLLVLPTSSVRSAKQDDDHDAANDDAAARLQCAETSALPKQPCDVTPQKFAEQLVFSEDGTTKTIDGEECRSRTLELSKGPNKGVTLVRYYPWCEVEPSDRAMKQAFLKKNMNPNKRAAAQEKHRNLMYAYTSNRLFPPSILTLRIHLIDHDHPSCHPLSSPTHHPCHPPSSSITNPHHVEYSPHPMPLPGGIHRSKRNIRPVFTSPITPPIHRHHPSHILGS